MKIDLTNPREWRVIVLPDLPADTRTDNAKRMQHAPYCHKCGVWSTKFTCDACQTRIRASMEREQLRRLGGQRVCEKCGLMYAMRASLWCAACEPETSQR